ncbi:MAG: cell envelope integrity protein CreD [Kordia sp.]|uniref:cell envelope integrity protein CreD n=1 Tax=Kordia sp. TaxID=1965332 RepID=UPI00385E23F0
MEIHQTEKNSKKLAAWFKSSISAKFIITGILTLLLMIPLSLIQDLIAEREVRQKSVVSELNDKWGNEILLYGPILKVPYKTYQETVVFNETTQETEKKQTTQLKYAYFFPKTLDINTDVKTTAKKRNNFETTVFTADIATSGSFEIPDFSLKSIANEDIVWDKATLEIKTTNLKGLKSEVKLNLNGNSYSFETKANGNSELDALESSYLALEDVPNTTTRSFDFKLTYNGSKSIRFVPIGKVTNVQMTSDWKHPKHTGSFITQSKRTTENGGFEANWKLLHTNRSFSQQYFKVLPNLNQYAFGTDFIIPLNEYQQSERAVKYGFLVIGLTFLVFFLIQTLSKISIHPFQYLMIGIALIMFYTLLISISEHSSFFKAYLIAGIAVIVMITLYSKSILKNWKFTLLIGSSLSALYSFIFVIIQMESYALLVGSIGLFIILGIVMYVSRKIDWDFDSAQPTHLESQLTTENS